MNIIDGIFSRRSVRKFTSRPISDSDLHTILAAGMSGPSAVNARPWSFIVVRDRDRLCQMADGNGSAAQPIKGAALGIMVLGDMSRTFERAPDYWVIDGSIAAQNMVLAAHGLGLAGHLAPKGEDGRPAQDFLPAGERCAPFHNCLWICGRVPAGAACQRGI